MRIEHENIAKLIEIGNFLSDFLELLAIKKTLYIIGIKYPIFSNVDIIITDIMNHRFTSRADSTIYHLLTKPPSIGNPIRDSAPIEKPIMTIFSLGPIPFISLIFV